MWQHIGRPAPRIFNCTALQGGETVNNYFLDGFSQTKSSAKAVFINLHIFLQALKGMAIEFAVRRSRSVYRSVPKVRPVKNGMNPFGGVSNNKGRRDKALPCL